MIGPKKQTEEKNYRRESDKHTSAIRQNMATNTLEEKKTSPGPPDLFRQFQTPAIAKKHTNKRSTKEEEKSKVWQSTDRTKTHVQRKINEGKKRDRDKGKQKI